MVACSSAIAATATCQPVCCAQLSCPLSCRPHLQLAKAVEKAIRQSPLSLNPTTEGAEVLVKLPRITKESIERMVKLVNMEAEGAHQSIRRARQKGIDAIKKAFKAASTDHRKRAEKEVRTCSVSLPG
eukprot:GHRR01037416.1.p1 GENE.GHRR01037416.1~~GHRR01037416.1.p1  ORF type:complete len:128 (-),score=30.65 GHRR01037416.1:140-523(-)